MNAAPDRPIVIAGAGSIGCFVGGLLLQAGRDVRFLGRAGLADQLRATGLNITSHTGLDARLPPATIRFDTDPVVLADAGTVIVTVKSAQTAAMAALIRTHAPADAIVLSLQNGIANPALLRQRLPAMRIVGGMVPFNVVRIGNDRFHQGSAGAVVIEAGTPGLRDRLAVPGLRLREDRDFTAVQWGKLLLNLNNALNALSGLPLRQELRTRAWRLILSDQIEEALAVLAASGIAPRSTTILPSRFLPAVLRLPTWLFSRLAAGAVRIDPEARSSMWDDTQRGRPTEIDELQGRIIALAEKAGLPVPANRCIAALIATLKPNDQGATALAIRALYRSSP